jgi:hypothetical protein
LYRSILAAGVGVLVATVSLEASAETCRGFFPWSCAHSSGQEQPAPQSSTPGGTVRTITTRQAVLRDPPARRQRKRHLASRPARQKVPSAEQVAEVDSVRPEKAVEDLDARQRDQLFQEFLAWRKRLSD